MEDLETSRRRRDLGQIQPTKIITASGLFESGFKERPGPLLERPGRFLPPGQLRGRFGGAIIIPAIATCSRAA